MFSAQTNYWLTAYCLTRRLKYNTTAALLDATVLETYAKALRELGNDNTLGL